MNGTWLLENSGYRSKANSVPRSKGTRILAWEVLEQPSTEIQPDKELEAMALTFSDAVASLEIRDGKAVIFLRQDIPESAGHVHKAFSLKVRRAVDH